MKGNQRYSTQFRKLFLRTWDQCDSTAEVMAALDLTKIQVKYLAKHFRGQGYELRCRKKVSESLLFSIDPEPCKEPTVFCPGSTAKIEVMRMRASRNEMVFHPRDADHTTAINRVEPRVDKQYVYKNLVCRD